MFYQFLFYAVLILARGDFAFASETNRGTTSIDKSNAMQTIKEGIYQIPFSQPEGKTVLIKSFLLDIYPVNNFDFLEFINKNSIWQPENMIESRADGNYLRLWKQVDGSYRIPANQTNYPVTNISWFAAKAYCEAQGKRLPTNNEWDYAALASRTQADGSFGLGYRKKILQWYSDASRAPNREIARQFPNYWGLYDMNAFIWQWTADYADLPVTDGSQIRQMTSQKLCTIGSDISVNSTDYLFYVRYAFRLNLLPNSTMDSLGFRCAK